MLSGANVGGYIYVMKAGAKEAKAMVEMASKMVDRITDDKK